MTNPRTVKGKANVLIGHRKRAGLTQEAVGSVSDEGVLEAANREIQAGIEDGFYTLRVKSRREKRLDPGLSKGAIAAAERGDRVYLSTLSILAIVYKVEVHELIEDEEDEDVAPRPDALAGSKRSADVIQLSPDCLDGEQLLAAIEHKLAELAEWVKAYRELSRAGIETRKAS